MNPLARMLDANANRAREGLRVMEDVARFALSSAALSAEIKTLRHDLREAIDALGFDEVSLVAARDTEGDVGTSIKTAAEGRRDDLRSIAVAAARRVTEALRVMEECAKADHVGRAAPMIERVRYRAYGAEKALTLALAGTRAPQWRLCVLLTESLCRLPWLNVARAAMAGGADCVQLREKGLLAAELLSRARALVNAASEATTRVSIIINDRPDVAIGAGADGVHLGQDDLPADVVRGLQSDGRRLLIGISTHNGAEAQRAIEAGADYCGVGAMFETATKARVPSGLGWLREYVEHETWSRTPHMAIGGITPENVALVVNSGACGVAVSSCVCGAGDPAAVCRDLRAAIERGAT
ncbi:MAG: thiamine phosphate synthase [Phycisphaerales bacterium]